MENPIKAFKNQITHYIHLRTQLLKLEAVDKGAKVMGFISFVFFLLLLLTLALAIISLALSKWFNQLLDSDIAGYFIMSAVLILMIVGLFAFRKQFFSFISNVVIRIATDDDDEDYTNKQEPSEIANS